MEKVFLILVAAGLSCTAFASNYLELPDSWNIEVVEPEQADEFWPADMVPHPHPPWDRRKKSDDGDLA